MTFQPEPVQLQRQLDALAPQVDGLVVVDNHSTLDLYRCIKLEPKPVGTIIRLERNHGIAKAQNVGIGWAREQGATHVLLMDQDSVPAPDMVHALLEAATHCPLLAAVGPCYLDSRQNNPPPFIRVRGLKLERLTFALGGPVVPVDYLISSGCLIPIAALDQVGMMREDLFIDYVDIEWGLRAGREGLQCYGVFAAAMHHNLGETPRQFLGRSLPVHTPQRHYYHVRNAILLYREPWVPTNWKMVDAWRLLLKFGFYSLMTPPRLQHLRMMLLAVWHGLKGRTGEFPP